MELTGRPDGPAVAPPHRLLRGLDRLVESLGRSSARVGNEVLVDWDLLVTTRARMMGLRRSGRRSANGTCRLLKSADGWMAINLARPEDLASVEALLQSGVQSGAKSGASEDTWGVLEAAIASGASSYFVDRARLLGMPAAALGDADSNAPPWCARRISARRPVRSLDELRIVDLSSLWAGPLAARLIWDCGGRVTKVESLSRPDSTREASDFFATLHPAEQELITLDFRSAPGKRDLEMLLADADVVIESSRPRALEQLGLAFSDVQARPGKVWLSITGYGRERPGRDWVAFGDDSAVAGGLVAWEDERNPVFCGDAIGDPITGMTAALAVFRSLADGGGVLLDVPMRNSVAHLCS